MKKQKILHIFPYEKFTDGYVYFINENFNKQDHIFLIHGYIKEIKLNCLNFKNVIYKRNIEMYLKDSPAMKRLLQYDKIFIHGVFSHSIIAKWCKQRKLMKKTYLYLWGGDFYPCSLNDTKMQNLQRRFLYRNVAGIINILPVENQIFKNLYHNKGRMFFAPYYRLDDISRYITEIKREEKIVKDDDRIVRIQIGNSATKTNEHKKILQYLSKFKNRNIEIYVPLSYGDKQYAAQVIQYGKKMFGNKFIAVTEFMDKNDYTDFIAKMDIGIFSMQRQQGLGNIRMHFELGNIVYLSRKSPLSEFYGRYMGCAFGYIEDIRKMEFETFRNMDMSDRENNSRLIEEYYSKENIIKRWNDIFCYKSDVRVNKAVFSLPMRIKSFINKGTGAGRRTTDAK